jgi:hypothetical protein
MAELPDESPGLQVLRLLAARSANAHNRRVRFRVRF